jgi:predicted transcriptional regulator of viral defense system
MKIEELADRVPENGLFRTGQILSGNRQPEHVRRQLDRWVKSGRVVQLRRGVYKLQKPYVSTGAHPFAIATVLKKASYVSLQSALSYYGMIPEYVPVTTSVTTGRPEACDNPLGRFLFRHISPKRFFGFTELEVAPSQLALIASPAKALLDLLYLTPHSDNPDYLRELRLTEPDGFDREELGTFVENVGSYKAERAVRHIIELWKENA